MRETSGLIPIEQRTARGMSAGWTTSTGAQVTTNEPITNEPITNEPETDLASDALDWLTATLADRVATAATTWNHDLRELGSLTPLSVYEHELEGWTLRLTRMEYSYDYGGPRTYPTQRYMLAVIDPDNDVKAALEAGKDSALQRVYDAVVLAHEQQGRDAVGQFRTLLQQQTRTRQGLAG